MRQVIRDGELTLLGQIRSASNATFLCESTLGETGVHCVYKPVDGEQPLWDFPDGTLAGREVAAFVISEQLDWNIVPYTVIRDGPAGPGMVQLWVDQPDRTDDGEPDLVDLVPADQVPPGYLPVLQARDYTGAAVTLVHADDPALFRMAVFDVLINNADRKAGHILRGTDDGVYGVDHGICLHSRDKLRTVLWGWAGRRIDAATVAAVAELTDGLAGPAGPAAGPVAEALGAHLTADEIGALGERARALLVNPVLPGPDRRRHAIPWPAF